MQMKFPTANGSMKSVKQVDLLAKNKPISVPIIAATPERRLNNKAFFLAKPEYSKTPKSASSWGISWNIIDIVATIPRVMSTV